MNIIIIVIAIHTTRPNRDMRKSDHDTNSLSRGLMSSASISCWWQWQTATEFILTSVIDVRSHVFSLRKALKLRSAWADDAGDTINSFTNWLTWSYSARTSGSICRRAVAASLTDVVGRVRRNIRSCAVKSVTFTSGYCDSISWCSVTSPVSSTFSSWLYLVRPSPLNRSVSCVMALSSRPKKIIGL